MNTLVDTDVLIQVLRGMSDASTKLQRRFEQGARVAYSPVSRAEVYAGMRPAERADTDMLFSLMECVPVTDAIGSLGGHFLSQFSRSHGVSLPGALIAATAVELDAELWTLNRKHFPMPELKLAD